jgi:hypothetical protein
MMLLSSLFILTFCDAFMSAVFDTPVGGRSHPGVFYIFIPCSVHSLPFSHLLMEFCIAVMPVDAMEVCVPIRVLHSVLLEVRWAVLEYRRTIFTWLVAW